jgi:hypothetical protein
MVQVVEQLPHKCKDLSSKPQYCKITVFGIFMIKLFFVFSCHLVRSF